MDPCPTTEVASPEWLVKLEEGLNEDFFKLVGRAVQAQSDTAHRLLNLIHDHAPLVRREADGTFVVSMRHAWARIVKKRFDKAVEGVELMYEWDEIRSEIAQRRLPKVRFVD